MITHQEFVQKKKLERDPEHKPEQQNKDSVFFTDLKFFDYTHSGRDWKEIKNKLKEMKDTSIYRRFVQPGRLVVFNFGPFFEGVGIISDIIDRKRILVTGPGSLTGVPRHVTTTSRVRLTDILVENCPRGASDKKIKELVAEQKVFEQWSMTKWAQKIRVRFNKRNFTDFERFKVKQAREKRGKLIREFRRNESQKANVQRKRAMSRFHEESNKKIEKLKEGCAASQQSVHDAVTHRAYARKIGALKGGAKVRAEARNAKVARREEKREALVKKLSGK